MIKVGSDFSGVGAFNQALMRLGVNYKEVFACDMDKYARQTFIHNYGEPEYYPTNVYDRQIPEEPLDIYMTSPPCQAFSLAGKRLGKEDKRGILFFNSHEFIKINKPRFFIFENVKGLLSDDGGNTFNEWVNMLGGKSVNGEPVLFPYDDSVPYHLYWKVLNAKHHGVPQNRERVFLIGIRDDKDNTFRWPVEEYLLSRLKDVLEDDVDEKYYLSENAIDGIANSTFCSRSNLLQEKDYSDCILARDYKDPKCIKVKSETIAELRNDESITFFKDDVCGTIRTTNACGDKVVIAAIRGRETEDGLQQQLEIGSGETSNSITTVQKDNVLIYKEFRTEEAKKKRKETGTNDFRDKECGFFEQDYSNTITSVQKDNLIFKHNNKRLNETLEKHELPKDKVVIIDSYNKSIHEDVSPTISTRINASNNTHLSIPTIDDKITIVQLNPSKESGGKQPYQQNRVYDSNGLCPALNAGQVTWGGNIITTPYDYRIRRLTPRECFRLMDFPDTFTWPVSDSQAYKQAGNSIVVNVLYKILKNLPL